MPGSPSLRLVTSCTASPLDARRGIVRIHRDIMNALGARPWDPLIITGQRVTGALAALANETSLRELLICDDLLLANAGVSNGAVVDVHVGRLETTRAIQLDGPQQIVDAVRPEALRLAMLNKVVAQGDRASLLPEELAAPGNADASAMYEAMWSASSRAGKEAAMVPLTVVRADPACPSMVTMATIVSWQGGAETATSGNPATTPAQLPGLESQMRDLGELLDVGFHGRALLSKLGSEPHMGVLVSGPAGSGKAAMVRAVATAVGARVVPLWAPKIAAQQPNDAAKAFTNLVDEAKQGGATVLLIEDADALLPTGGGPLSSLVIEQIRALLSAGNVAVVGTTSRLEELDPVVRASDALTHQIGVAAPSRAARQDILRMLTKTMPLGPDVELADVAAETPGYVGADLLSLCREAALQSAHRSMSATAPDTGRPTVTKDDFSAALGRVRPSVLDTGFGQPTVTLDDVGDLEEVKQILKELVLWPLTYPNAFARLGVTPPHGVLLYGPPGCGKTFVVAAFAAVGQANLISVKGPELLSKWVGESERGVRDLFRRARDAAPSIVFLDEVDALAPIRGRSLDSDVSDRVVAALLAEIDGVDRLHDVVVVAATNRPDLIDQALLRPGRLERLVYLPPPDEPARLAILRAVTRNVPVAEDVVLQAVAATTEGYSAADLAGLVREAALCALRESMDSPAVAARHLERAAVTVRSSLDPEQVAKLSRYASSSSSGETGVPTK